MQERQLHYYYNFQRQLQHKNNKMVEQQMVEQCHAFPPALISLYQPRTVYLTIVNRVIVV